jgi:hypothetical protein
MAQQLVEAMIGTPIEAYLSAKTMPNAHDLAQIGTVP